ncbi:outer membrane protein assembly factor [Maribacter algarum]|uniref:Outer membrane protein assembly factor n=1 Tax=Maribacter algarum (ex Zhang et al. 2020) TaxID=2578118 RepID=A0A5S3PU04_9FLAO|nr:BamA/TamA family outer membrane protein [Maribacter algarum]TMM56170.1 outer membrane protein assembly factor [Maribacter algarum]
MRTLLPTKKSSAKISLLLIALAITSCNSLKRVDDDELLIKRNTIWADSIKVVSEDIEGLIIQEPNSDLLGYPLRLNLYNLAKPNPDSSYQNWLLKKPKRKQRLTNFLSEKQVNRLGESFMVKGLSEWLKKIGEAPAILDTTLTRKTLERLKAYYNTKGYFNNTTNYDIDFLKRKQRVEVHYNIDLGDPYMLDSLAHKITSSAIDSIYNLVKADSEVKPGQQFDLDNFNKERERLNRIFRNRGVYDFQESSIKFDVIADTAQVGNDTKMDIALKIDDLKKRDESSVTTQEYKVFKFDKINVYTDYLSDDSEGELKFERFGDYTIYYRDKLRFKPKTLTNAIFFKKDSLYRDIDRIRTLRQMTSLNVFKYPSLTFVEDSTRTYLTSNIYLATKPKYTFAPNLEVTTSNRRKIGIGVGLSLLIRNVFKGAENLSLSGYGTFGLLSGDVVENSFSEIGADANLSFPRIWFPIINTDKIIPNYMLPQTNLSLGTSFQKNIGLDKQTFNTILGYNWTPTEFKKNNFELLNIQFVNNKNTDRFFEQYNNTYNRLNQIANQRRALVNPAYFDSNDDLTTPVDVVNPEDAGTTGFIRDVLQGTIPVGTGDDEFSQQNFNDVKSISEREVRLTENNLIFSSNYTFNTTNRTGVTDNSFSQFRFKIESAGNFLSALSYIIPFDQEDNGLLEEDNDLLVFDVPYSQYVKTEFDYVKYWDLSKSNVLAFRSFLGIAIPFGNSDNIPFVRSYFAGGANDNRAWRPYELGPGRTNAANDFNEANLKLALNLEYRFPIAGNFKGALFADAGNIWNVLDNVDDPEATFNGIESLKDIALGTGFGIRYDFTYFVVRGDLAFKTYNPGLASSRRWFNDSDFAPILQVGINYPF